MIVQTSKVEGGQLILTWLPLFLFHDVSLIQHLSKDMEQSYEQFVSKNQTDSFTGYIVSCSGKRIDMIEDMNALTVRTE